MERNPYTVQFAELTADEKEFLDASRAVLERGDMLFGPDYTHINWALSQAAYVLEQELEIHENVSLFFELRQDRAGIGIAIITLADETPPGSP